MHEEICFDFPAEPSHLVDIRLITERVADRMGFCTEQAEMISTCVWEAVRNAVTHGSPMGLQQRVQVVVRAEGEDLCISVTSQNPDFILGEFRPVLTPVRPRGRGLVIIRTFMDEVRLVRGENGMTLVMTKRLTPECRRGEGC